MNKLLCSLCLCALLAGCMPSFQVQQIPMKIQGKDVVYVAAAWHNGQGVNAAAIDRYIDGQLVAHDLLVNSGIVEAILPAVVGAVAPIATGVGPYIK